MTFAGGFPPPPPPAPPSKYVPKKKPAAGRFYAAWWLSMTLGWSTSGKPPLVTNVRLASPSPPPPIPAAADDPRPPPAGAFFFLRTLPLASGGIFWVGSGGMEATPGTVPITLWMRCDTTRSG